jgi:hypothetical protein
MFVEGIGIRKPLREFVGGNVLMSVLLATMKGLGERDDEEALRLPFNSIKGLEAIEGLAAVALPLIDD